MLLLFAIVVVVVSFGYTSKSIDSIQVRKSSSQWLMVLYPPSSLVYGQCSTRWSVLCGEALHLGHVGVSLSPHLCMLSQSSNKEAQMAVEAHHQVF